MQAGREIKFRGKRLDTSEWVYGYIWIIPGINQHYILTGKIDLLGRDFIEKYEVDPETIGQFIGLNDNNGNEIYEGDVVLNKEDNQLATVKYDSSIAQYYLDLFERGSTAFVVGELIVKGNIYEKL